MNVKLLRKVAKHILAEPKRFAMDWWYGKAKPGKPVRGFDEAVAPACGTVACIAGWTVALSGIRPQINTVDTKAMKLLGIDDLEADRLFMLSMWPSHYRSRFDYATQRGKARVAAQRIEHFIKTGE